MSSAPEPVRPYLTLEESVGLVTCVVDRVARDASVRALFIKGPTLTQQGLREPHRSVDVDVLVSPGDKRTLLDALKQIGWRVPVEPTGGLVLPLHSATLKHPDWANEIDLHDRFPGFLAEPDLVFESLWHRRTTATVAGRTVPCPNVVAHGAVAALHWLRDGPGFNEEKLDQLYRTLDESLDADQRDDLVDLATETGAVRTLRPMFGALGIEPVGSTDDWADDWADDYDDTAWRIRTASTGMKSVGWVEELRRTPLRRLPGRLWHAVVLTEAEIRHEQPAAAPGAWGLFVARLRRLRYGVRALPRAVHVVWRERRR